MEPGRFPSREALRWIQIGGAAAALALAAAIGVLLATHSASSLLFLVVAAACVPLLAIGLDLALRHPAWQVLAILLAAAFIPVSASIPTGTDSRIVASFILAMLFEGFWLLRLVFIDRRGLEPSPVNRPLLGFLLATLFSLVWGNLFRDPTVVLVPKFPLVQLASALTMITLPGAMLMVEHFWDLRTLKIAVGIMLVVGALGAVVRYANLSLPVNTEGIAGSWIVGLAMGLVLFQRKLPWPARAALVLLTGAWVGYSFVLHTNRLSPWLAEFVMLGVLLFRRSKWLAVAMAAVLVAGVLLNLGYYQGVISGKQVESGDTRLAAWEVNWQVTGQHWLFGTGPAGYALYYLAYFQTNAMATHSNYVDILAETGIVGFGLYIWMFGVLVWEGYKLCRRLEGRGDFAEAMANVAFAGTLACLVVMGFGDWLIPFAYTQTINSFGYEVYSWLFMGMTLLLNRLVPAAPALEPVRLP